VWYLVKVWEGNEERNIREALLVGRIGTDEIVIREIQNDESEARLVEIVCLVRALEQLDQPPLQLERVLESANDLDCRRVESA
jgi:hypothetical protein